jgi:Uma2 family endonuclease
MAVITTSHITEHDLLALGADVWAEVLNGKLIVSWPKPPTEGELNTMAPVGFLHGIIAGNVYDALKLFAKTHKLGYVQGDGVIYILEQDDAQGIRTALVPDVFFVHKDRIPPDFDLARPFPGTPDLAVEVISPHEAAADVQDKVTAYLDAGTQQVWVLYPKRGELHLYTRPTDKTQVTIHSGSDQLPVDELFPGLELTTDTLFALPDLNE